MVTSKPWLLSLAEDLSSVPGSSPMLATVVLGDPTSLASDSTCTHVHTPLLGMCTYLNIIKPKRFRMRGVKCLVPAHPWWDYWVAVVVTDTSSLSSSGPTNLPASVLSVFLL